MPVFRSRPRQEEKTGDALKHNHRKPAPPPINVQVPAIGFDTCSLSFPNGERWIFNLTQARQLVRIDARRDVHWLSHDDLGRLIQEQVKGRRFDKKTIDGQDHKIPGIGVVLDYGGQRRLNLIDGLERAVKAFVSREGFHLYVLDDAERNLCLWSKTGIAGIAKKILEG